MPQPPADGCPREFPAAALGGTALWPEVTLSRSFIGSALSRYAGLADVGPQTQKQAVDGILRPTLIDYSYKRFFRTHASVQVV